MLMLIITNTERRNAVTGVRPLQFNNARQALEAVKGQLKMHVATIHAETLQVDDTIPLVIGFVGRGNAAESVLANVMAANGDDTPAFLERCGVLAAYQLPETNDTEVLNGYVDEVHRNLATYLPTPEGALGSAEPLTIDGLELMVGSPLNVVVSSDGAQLGRNYGGSEYATQAVDAEEVADVNVTEQQPEVETPVVAEAQPVTQTQIQTEETVMSATNMTKAELMRAARQLHSDLAASVPNFLPIEAAFGDASRLRRYCTLSLSDLPQPVLAELQERAEEVVACLQELAALTATQGDELEPTVAQEVAGDDEDFAPVPDQQLDAEDDEEFEEVETEVETDDEVGTVDGDADTDTDEVGTDADNLDLNDAGVLAEKLPAIFLLTQGRLDEIEGVMAPVAEFAMEFKAEQGEDFNGFDESDVAEAVESGELVNVMTLLDDCDWLDAASFDLLYELDGNLTDVCSEAGFDVQGEVDQSGVDLDAGDEDEEMQDDTGEVEWDEDYAGDEDEGDEDTEVDLQLVQVSISPRLVLNLVCDFNGHSYTKEQRRALMAMPTESGRLLNFAYGIASTDRETGSQGAYIRAIGRTAKALGQLSGATVLLPESHATITADKLAATVAAAATGSDINELLHNVLEDLQGVEVDDEGNVLLGFAADDGDDNDPQVALSDLCDFEVKYSTMREHDFGPATIEVTAMLSMRMPLMGYAKTPETIAVRMAALANKMTERYGVEVYPAVTFNAADRIFNRAEEYEDRNITCLPQIVSALVEQVNTDESPWAGAVVASHRAVTETGMYGIGLLVDAEAEQYVPLYEVVDIDAYASVGNDAAAILCTPIGASLFNMGGDTAVLLTRAKGDADDEDETEIDDAE
jgi:hypothetical protein